MNAENSDNNKTDKTRKEIMPFSKIHELELKKEQKRSNVRIVVTYASIGIYLILASIVIVWNLYT